MSTPRSELPSSGRATPPMQTDVWMFRAKTMKMAEGCFNPMHWKRPLGDARRKIKRPVGKHTTTCTDVFFWAATCPVQNEVINVYRHLDVSSPNNEDGRWSFDPMHQNRPMGRRSPAKSDGLWESKQPHAGTLFGTATCPVQRDVMKASSSMQTVVEAGAWLGESTSTTG